MCWKRKIILWGFEFISSLVDSYFCSFLSWCLHYNRIRFYNSVVWNQLTLFIQTFCGIMFGHFVLHCSYFNLTKLIFWSPVSKHMTGTEKRYESWFLEKAVYVAKTHEYIFILSWLCVINPLIEQHRLQSGTCNTIHVVVVTWHKHPTQSL